MIQINSREARAQWGDLLDAIQSGTAVYVIERYGKPVGLVYFDCVIAEMVSVVARRRHE